MADTTTLKDKIRSTIYPNGKGAINALEHQSMLLEMADVLIEANNNIEVLQTEQESNSVAIEDLQENKVDHGSYAPDLSVGVADHLAGHDEPTASEFTFRKSGGGAILSGNARVQSVKGNSVVWNQLINETYLGANDATITKTDTGYTIVPTGVAPGLRTLVPNGDIIPIVGHKYAIICEKVGGSRAMYLNWGGFNTRLTAPIITATDATKTQLTIYSYNETETFTITTPLLIDLTQMFGAGNEPTTIEEYHSRIPQGIDMDAYNEGEVVDMRINAIESCDADGNICRVQSLDIISRYFPDGMRSAGSAHDEIRYNKATQKWEAVKRIGEVDLGTLDWALTSQLYFRALLPSDSIAPTNTDYNGFICAKYERVDFNLIYGQQVAFPCFGIPANNPVCCVSDSSYTDTASFKAAMQGVILYYELANPVVTEIEEAFNLDYEVWNGGTEQAIADTPTSAFKADIIYGFNAYGVIKELREQLATLQAAIAKMNV